MATKAKRNRNGRGSVTFHKGNGKWLVRMTVGFQRVGHYFKTKDAADRKLKELQYKYDVGEKITSDHITLNQVISQWIADKERKIVFGKLKQVTMDNYLSLIDIYIKAKIGTLNSLGSRDINTITKDNINDLFKYMIQNGKSNAVINHVRAVLIDIMNFAMDDDREYIEKNPAIRIEKFDSDRRDAPLRTPNQINELLAKIKTDYPNLYEFYYTYLHTGLRRNELLALRWKDLVQTPDGRSISVSRSFYRGKGGKEYFGKPKNGKNRMVPLSTANALLFSHIQERYKEYGISIEPDDRIFRHIPSGRHLLPDYATKTFSKIVKSLGWDNFHLHDLRGTHGSLLMAAGHTLKDIQSRLGQTSDVTMDYYIRTNEERDRELANNLDNNFKELGIHTPE